jgi:hypothetical protein
VCPICPREKSNLPKREVLDPTIGQVTTHWESRYLNITYCSVDDFILARWLNHMAALDGIHSFPPPCVTGHHCGYEILGLIVDDDA